MPADTLTGARLVEAVAIVRSGQDVDALTPAEALEWWENSPEEYRAVYCRDTRDQLRAQAEAAGVTAEGLLWVANIPTAHAVPEVPALLRALAEVLRDE